MKFLAIDGYNLIRRIFEARHVLTVDDMASVIEASMRSVSRALKTHKPSHAVIVLEEHGRTWRHLLYPEYKANRSETPTLLVDAIPQFVEAFQSVGVSTCNIESYEADDVIATMAVAVSSHGGQVVILSTDKVFLQLVDSKVNAFDHFAEQCFDEAYIQERYGIEPGQYLDYLAMVGDKSNNIKGVTGIGPKSAKELLNDFSTLANVLQIESDNKLVKKVQSASADAQKALQLVTLKRDVQLGVNLKTFRLPPQ
jgi:protein Xni